ncbi:MAG: hypothetical protein AAF828_00805 [Bacteroidota bacterium]
MSTNLPITIAQEISLPPAEDYQSLKQAGYAAIEELGHQQWTDYNDHDPGITNLQALCYALSEIGYRAGFDMADLLTEESGYISFRQALFTARQILTNNPLTINDFRKLLIDLPAVTNGWLLCKSCACETTFYAECADEALFHAPQWRLAERADGQSVVPHEHPLFARGLYDVLLQLDIDPTLGDLNNNKVIHRLNVLTADGFESLTIETRFPDWARAAPELYAAWMSEGEDFSLNDINLISLSRDPLTGEEVTDDSLIQGWDRPFFAHLQIQFQPSAGDPVQTIELRSVPIRFFARGRSVVSSPGMLATIRNLLEETGANGIIHQYRQKLLAAEAAVASAKASLHTHRNLAEDYCRIERIKTEDVAFCADVEVTADADIEFVLASIFYEIERHLNPQVPFHTLEEMVEAGLPTEDIFLGPALDHGFIKEEDLNKTELRSSIKVSDIYNRLMDIPGLLTVSHVQFTRYDDAGRAIMPSHQWNIPVRALHLPRLYLEASRVLFYKDGLPFTARMDEVSAILAQLRGQDIQGKLAMTELDYPVPVGRFRNLSTLEPVQHTFPLAYGIGPAGLPPRASDLRRSQAQQLKAYLMPFEQLLADMNEQIDHVKDLFSTDEAVDRTYFTHFFDPAAATPEIAQLPDLVNAEYTTENLQATVETPAEYADRRNRFLDHLLARFGEQFTDYALLLNANADRIAFDPTKLIRDKIRFLRFYPSISRDRARAIDYRNEELICDPRNQAGISERIARLLGMESLISHFDVQVSRSMDTFTAVFTLSRTLADGSQEILLTEAAPIVATSGTEAETLAWDQIAEITSIGADSNRYVPDGPATFLETANGERLAVVSGGLAPAEVQDFIEASLAAGSLHTVEHLLLRPMFPGAPLMDVCLGEDCTFCGEEDPYSFRLTYVLQGDLAPFSYDIDLRQFADRTIRRETPAHLLPKICWVGNRDVEKDLCAPVFGRMLNVFADLGGDRNTICDQLETLYDACDQLYQVWFADRRLAIRNESAWEADLQVLFAAIDLNTFPFLAALTDEERQRIGEMLLAHFVDLSVRAFQFDRFTAAWCDWLTTNAPFEWKLLNANLQGRVESWLRNLLPSNTTLDFCNCIGLLLGHYGDRFNAWINSLLRREVDITDTALLTEELNDRVWSQFREDLTQIFQNDPRFCRLNDLLPTDPAWEELRDLLTETYLELVPVALRLARLLVIFQRLFSIYPTATLHDCDDGSDDNPVRLDHTILGSL